MHFLHHINLVIECDSVWWKAYQIQKGRKNLVKEWIQAISLLGSSYRESIKRGKT